ncbi:unnamed protein product, partial [Iphiclides podalirius]
MSYDGRWPTVRAATILTANKLTRRLHTVPAREARAAWGPVHTQRTARPIKSNPAQFVCCSSNRSTTGAPDRPKAR